MAIDNLISITLTDEEVKTMNDAVKAINDVLKGKAVNLTPDERKQYGSIADKNKVFVDKCKAYMETNPHTIPNVLNKEDFDKDYKARQQLETPLRSLLSVLEKLQDTKILLDHDNYHAATSYYRYMKYLSSENEPGTTSIYNDLKQHYKRSAQTKGQDADNSQQEESSEE